MKEFRNVGLKSRDSPMYENTLDKVENKVMADYRNSDSGDSDREYVNSIASDEIQVDLNDRVEEQAPE